MSTFGRLKLAPPPSDEFGEWSGFIVKLGPFGGRAPPWSGNLAPFDVSLHAGAPHLEMGWVAEGGPLSVTPVEVGEESVIGVVEGTGTDGGVAGGTCSGTAGGGVPGVASGGYQFPSEAIHQSGPGDPTPT